MQNTNSILSDSLNITEFEELIGSRDDIRLIDIRDIFELEMLGKISGTEHIIYNSSNFIEKIMTLPRDTFYCIYCNSGVRTSHTLKIMKALGFKQVVHLAGGIQAWIQAGKKVENHPSITR